MDDRSRQSRLVISGDHCAVLDDRYHYISLIVKPRQTLTYLICVKRAEKEERRDERGRREKGEREERGERDEREERGERGEREPIE